MQIRTRISILSVLVTLIVSAVIVFGAAQRENLIGKRYSNQIIADQLILWNKVKDGLIDDMENLSWLFSQNRPLINALESQNLIDIQRIGAQLKAQLEQQHGADRVDLVLPDGTLAYSSQGAVFQSAIISNAAIEQAIENEAAIRGVGNDKQRNTALVYGRPIFADNGDILGLAVLGLNIVNALAEIEEVNESSVVIVNRRGRLLVSTGDNLWAQYSDLIDINQANELQTIEDDGRYFSVIVLPQSAELGGLVGRLLNIREVTESVRQQQEISRLTAIAILVFLGLAIVGIYLYLAHAFAPLTEGVNVLSALSKGDLQAQIEGTTRRDEVGLIANAVNVFRANLLTLHRFRRSRERQQGRQQRFIFREMQGLTDTLEGQDREELLHELEKLGNLVENEVNTVQSELAEFNSDPSASNRQHDSDSLAMLAVAFQGMSSRVRDQNQRLREALATKEALIALRSELNIATRVQQSLLPGNIQMASTYNIWGGMWPAKEVGGDFYDFFPLGDDRLAIAIADVSGKGVPAALFTVMSRTMLHSTAAFLDSPGKALSVINNFLERNNDEGLFVTVFYGILNLTNGRLTYANGGHNSPIVADSQGVRTLPTTNGMVLAMFSNLHYKDAHVDLEPGSRLVMLTDGIPEAFNAKSEAYGDDRLLSTIDKLPDQGPEDDVRTIVGSVNEFVDEAPQFDDIACVVIRYTGNQGVVNAYQQGLSGTEDGQPEQVQELQLLIKHDLAELARIATEIESHGEAYDWPSEWVFNVNLSLDELITNIVNYGYDEGATRQDIELTLKIVNGNLWVVLVDDGNEFDPFVAVSTPMTDAPIEERKVGGLGIFFVKSLVNETRYERENELNRITLILYPPQPRSS